MSPQEERPEGIDYARLIDTPDAWPGLDDVTMKNAFALQCHRYSLNCSRRAMELAGQMYDELEARFDPHQRVEIEKRVVTMVLAGHAKARMLIPFIFLDPCSAVVSTTALDYAVLESPDERHGPLTGFMGLLGFARPDSGFDEMTRAGVLQGLVLLGDRRLLSHLRGCWNWLGDEGREALAAVTSDGVISAGLVEFLLEWLEQTRDERNFGGIFGTLYRMPSISPDGLIHDIERAFPVRPTVPPIRQLASWTFPEYYERIRARINRIAERETEPKLAPELANAWCNLP